MGNRLTQPIGGTRWPRGWGRLDKDEGESPVAAARETEKFEPAFSMTTA